MYAMAQQPAYSPNAADTNAQKQIIIIHADRINYQKTDSLNELQSLGGHVAVKQGKSLFYCDSAVINKYSNIMQAYGHVHINDADSVQIYSDYLRYLGKEKMAYLTGNVKLTDGRGVLTTPTLEYNMQTKIGIYTQGGKVENGKTVLTSKEGYYYEETRDVYFKKNVVLIDPDYKLKTDTLLYNTYSDVATFIAPTTITSENNKKKVIASDGYYDAKNRKTYLGKRPTIQDGTVFLTADEVATDDSTGFGEARGNVIYNDTAQHVMVIANNMKSNNKNKSFLATERPVLILKQGEDSIFVAADTLYSARLSNLLKYRTVPFLKDSLTAKDTSFADDDSTDRFFEAYYHVKIYSDSLQAMGDSLFYSAKDSIFRLFKKPVVWAKENQVTGDTIYLYTQNKKPSRLYVFENALAINKVGSNYYNQIKGRTLNGYFTDGNIDRMRVKGNSESVYYAQDDYNKFVGVNKSTADIIDMYFNDRKPQRVVFRSSLSGTSYPMRKVDHTAIRLRGFTWLDDLRPKTKYDLFGDF